MSKGFSLLITAMLALSGALAFARSPANIKLCDQVAQRLNDGTLEQLYLETDNVPPPYKPPKDEFDLPILQSGRIDINSYVGEEDFFIVGDHEYTTMYVYRNTPNREPSILDVSRGELKLLTYSNKVYVLQIALEQTPKLFEFDRSLESHAVCDFAAEEKDNVTRHIRALSDYEIVTTGAREAYKNVWEYALEQSTLDAAESLLANGHKVTETIGSTPLLSWAVLREKHQIVEWLLAHGAPVNDSRDYATPFQNAMAISDPYTAIRLIRAGAKMDERAISKVAEYAHDHPGNAQVLMLEVINATNKIPHNFVSYALKSQPTLMTEFLESGYAVELDALEWQAGRKTTIPYWLAAQAYFDSTPDHLKTLQKLYRGKLLPPQDAHAISNYGTFESGLSVSRYRRSPVSDGDFLLFSTNVCMHFLTDDCGPKALQGRARKWLAALPQECSPKYRDKMDPMACKVLTHYIAISQVLFDRAVLIGLINAKTYASGTPITTDVDLIAMYRKRNGEK